MIVESVFTQGSSGIVHSFTHSPFVRLFVENSQFIENVGTYGPAVSVLGSFCDGIPDNTTHFFIKNTFLSNVALFDGGAIFSNCSNSSINSNFTHNQVNILYSSKVYMFMAGCSWRSCYCENVTFSRIAIKFH